MEPAVTIATSIAPGRPDRQRAAVDSWIAHGFRVISVNSTREVGPVAESFPDVTIVDAGELASQHTQRSLAPFDLLLRALKEGGADVCGIVNSDICWRTAGALSSRVAALARGRFVFGSRLDVANANDPTGDVYHRGFDYFFFDRALIDIFPASPFLIGAPWWDLWCPIVPIVRGVEVRRIEEPIAFHERHDGGWTSGREWQDFGSIFVSALRKLLDDHGRREAADDEFFAILADRLFAHRDLLLASSPRQNADTQALIRLLDEQILLVVAQAAGAFVRRRARPV